MSTSLAESFHPSVLSDPIEKNASPDDIPTVVIRNFPETVNTVSLENAKETPTHLNDNSRHIDEIGSSSFKIAEPVNMESLFGNPNTLSGLSENSLRGVKISGLENIKFELNDMKRHSSNQSNFSSIEICIDIKNQTKSTK
jgi:hypothetical protein